jgi:hypothetical protein
MMRSNKLRDTVRAGALISSPLGGPGPRTAGHNYMNEPSPAVRELSRHVIDRELAGLAPDQFGTGIEQAFGRLREVLSPLVGQVGVEAVFARAVHLTRPSHSWAARLVTSAGDAGSPAAARDGSEIIDWQNVAEVRECAVQLIGHVLCVLCGFIGEDLTFRLVERAWSGLPGPSGSDPQEA